MLVRAFENWALFCDNGIWDDKPHIFSTTLFTKVMSGARGKVIDNVIYIIRRDGPAYKIDLKRYTERQQEKIIDNLYPILE